MAVKTPSTAPPVTRGSYFSTSVGKKVVMAVTGLLLLVYLVLHLAGNLLIYFGPSPYNAYSHFLIVNPLIIPIEIGLLATFLLHVYEAGVNWLVNRRARPVAYYQPYRRLFGHGWAGKPSRKSIASTSMIVTGLIVIVFVIIHVMQFKYGPEYLTPATSDTPGIRDLYRLELENFGQLWIVVFYVFCMTVIGFHLWHGISSALNSLGVEYRGSTATILRVTRVAAVILAGGFLLIPIWVFFLRG